MYQCSKPAFIKKIHPYCIYFVVFDALFTPEVLQEADCHIGGTPCVDYSPRGALGGEEGVALICFLAWLMHRAAIQEAYIIHENVPGFLVETLSRALSKWYDVETTVMDAAALGWPISRKRRYTVLRHKMKSLPFRSPLTVFTRMFLRAQHQNELDDEPEQPTWSCFMVATLAELQDELHWASQRPMSQAALDDSLHQDEDLNPLSGHSYHMTLTQCEHDFLDIYEKRFPNCAYSLNQNPDFGATHSSATHLQCLIKNLGILWMLVKTRQVQELYVLDRFGNFCFLFLKRSVISV